MNAKKKTQHLALAVAVLVLAGCGSESGRLDTSGLPTELQSVLEGDHVIELFSLNPEPPDKTTVDKFHGWEVLGQAQLDQESAAKITTALLDGIANAPNYVAACFNPRHGLRITGDENSIDVVICFECVQVYVYSGETRLANLRVAQSPLKSFDAVVNSHGLPKPPPAHP